MPINLYPFHRYHQLVDLFRELGFKNGAEVGTAEGRYASVLCAGIPDLKLYCIDPWKSYPEYPEPWVTQNEMDRLYEYAKKKLSRYNCEIIRKTSMDAVKDFAPNSLDFVFIDGNHDFEYLINDIIAWMKIVKPGGILCGHDYIGGKYRGFRFHTTYAVQAFAEAYEINPWFVLKARRTVDSWMWVKS